MSTGEVDKSIYSCLLSIWNNKHAGAGSSTNGTTQFSISLDQDKVELSDILVAMADCVRLPLELKHDTNKLTDKKEESQVLLEEKVKEGAERLLAKEREKLQRQLGRDTGETPKRAWTRRKMRRMS